MRITFSKVTPERGVSGVHDVASRSSRGDDVSTTDKVTEAASLADAVLTAEAERQAAHEEE